MEATAFPGSVEAHAVKGDITPTSASVTRRRRGQGRIRPFLSQACQKTKLCKFFLEGTCGRGDECTFAHGAEQIQTLPDLHCTKFCPMMESAGECKRGSKCKFAHSVEELRGLLPGLRSMLPSTCQETDARVVSALNRAATAGALSLGEMIMHLTQIFAVTSEARPPRTTNEVPTELLAVVTAEQAWESLNLARSERLAFEDFLRLSLPPSRCVENKGSRGDDVMSEQSTVASGDDSTPRSLVCQTPSRRPSWSQTPSPHAIPQANSPSTKNLLFVRNTFIEMKAIADTPTTRRTRSLPPSSNS